jgi:hypothetical protein
MPYSARSKKASRRDSLRRLSLTLRLLLLRYNEHICSLLNRGSKRYGDGAARNTRRGILTLHVMLAEVILLSKCDRLSNINLRNAHENCVLNNDKFQHL